MHIPVLHLVHLLHTVLYCACHTTYTVVGTTYTTHTVLGIPHYLYHTRYAMLIPALLMGNVAVLKLPAIGGLVHCLTATAFAKTLPPGVINFVSGSGRATMAPIMQARML